MIPGCLPGLPWYYELWTSTQTPRTQTWLPLGSTGLDFLMTSGGRVATLRLFVFTSHLRDEIIRQTYLKRKGG